MAKCDVCGNEYDRSFQVSSAGKIYTFDSFECAIHKLAPKCGHCACRIIGHGVEANGAVYCCASCARMSGVKDVVDNAAHAAHAGAR
ncbi:MAG TPA: hypothetical protein VKH19_15590 [Gemmatimonadaceae bacterium]|nr:hypothetical protein [Gemmatimonadaceae bacterium]